MTGPTYKPRDAYRTRGSGEEDGGEPPSDFAATALDRPVADISDLKRAALMEQVERDRRGHQSRSRAKRMLILGLGIAAGVGLLLGVAFGAYLALS